MQIQITSQNYYKQNPQFGASIKNYKSIVKAITKADNIVYSPETKVNQLNFLKNMSDAIKTVGDSETTIEPKFIENGLEQIFSIYAPKTNYKITVTNEKFPNLEYNHLYTINGVNIPSEGIDGINFFFNRLKYEFCSTEFIKYKKTEPSLLAGNIKAMEACFLRHLSNLSKKQPHEVLKMYNVNDAYWHSIADEVKGYTPYIYNGIENDRKIFHEKYIEYLTKRISKN